MRECSHAQSWPESEAPISPLSYLHERVHRVFTYVASSISRQLSHYQSLPRFAREAKAHASVLPVYSRQLRDAVDAIEIGTQSVCSNFQQMASLAQSSANMGALLVDAEGSRNVNKVIQDCRMTMTQLLDRLEQSGKLYAQAISQMQRVDSCVQRVFETLKELDQSSFASRLVSLNAKIEAVHLGELGSGFEVVADQISAQAHRSSELTASVAEILTDLTETMHNATTELHQLAVTDKQAADHSRSDAEKVLENLQHASSEMQNTVAETRRMSETLYSEISNAVISMQFQDRVSQRIGHVIDSLDAMNRALSGFDSISKDMGVEDRKREIEQTLAATYTMDSERRAHSADSSGAPAAAEIDGNNSGDVELF